MPAINWTPEELAALATITPAELQEVLVLWRQYAPRQAREALTTAAGVPVPRAVLDPTFTAVSREAVALATSVQTGAADVGYYQLQMADLVRFTHLAGAGAAVGGLQALTLADVALVELARQLQLGYLLQLAQGLASGEILTDGRFLRRSQMYIDAGRGTYYDVAEQGFTRLGFDRVRSVRSARDSCRQCIDLDGREFEIGDPAYVKPGRRICLSSCLCYEEYIISGTGERRLL